MRRMVIGKCNELRQNHSRRPTSDIVQELVQEVASPRFDDYSAPEKRAMVEHLACPSERGAGNLNRAIRWNIRRGQEGVTPGALADGRFKQIPPEHKNVTTLHDHWGIRWRSSFPTPVRFSTGWWFRTQIEPLGGVAAIEGDHCNFLTDFEIPAINALRSTMNVNYYRCLFHYAQCILRNRVAHHLQKVFKNNAAVAVFFRRLQVLPLLSREHHGTSEALIHPQVPSRDAGRRNEARRLYELLAR